MAGEAAVKGLKPIADAVDAAAGAVPGTNKVQKKTGDGAEGDVVGFVTDPRLAWAGLGIATGAVLEKMVYSNFRGTMGYSNTLTATQKRNRLFAKLGIGGSAGALGALSDNGAVQWFAAGLATIEGVHIAQHHNPLNTAALPVIEATTEGSETGGDGVAAYI